MNLQRVNYNYTSATVISNTPAASFSVSPTVGYFVINSLMIGLQGSYGHGWTLNNPNYKSNNGSIGPVIRYYFPFGKFALFPELATSFDRSTIKSPTFDPLTGGIIVGTTKTKDQLYKAGIGTVWFATPNIGIEGVFGYRKLQYKEPSYLKSATNLYFTVGIQFYLPKTN